MTITCDTLLLSCGLIPENELAKGAGVTLTTVGATYPYGKDPMDKNLRIAPTYPTDEEVEKASKILVVSVKMAALEKIMSER